jgi:hypothetical protein
MTMTTNNDTKAITYADGAQKIDLDEHTAAKVVESLVLRGDLSGLGPRERANHYIAVCHGLGLNPASKPLDYLKLNGKEILYPNKGATDQLAAIHKVTREIIDGPKVMDLAGTKLVYAQCRASLPGGRFETSVATVPLVDPVNVLMKVETKAKRRATLSILGLGMLDEMELETIPANAQEPGGGVDLRAARLPATTAQEPPQRPANPLPALGIEAPPKRPQNAAETPAQSVNPVPTQEPPAWRVALDALHESAPDLAAYCNAVEALTLPGDAAPVWRSHRAAIGAMSKETKGSAWGALVARVESLGQKGAATWLTKGVKTLDAQTDAPAATEVTP